MPTADTPRSSPNDQQAVEPDRSQLDSLWATVASPAGYILAVSYPVLALSTGVRALYQYAFRDDIAALPVVLSGSAAICYLVAAIGFAYRRPTWWWVSVVTLSFELVMVLLVGTWSLVDSERIGHTVWRHFGADYGYFPLLQPFVGLAWLLWPVTRRAYGIEFARPHAAQRADSARSS